MELTPVQRRTFEALISREPAAYPPPDLPDRLRALLEEALDDLDPPAPIWLSKEPVAAHARCEGLFHAHLLREEPFAHSRASAAGTLAHRAIQADVASEGTRDVRTLVEGAALRLGEDPQFAPYWEGLEEMDRAEVLAEAARSLALFRDLFPPLRRSWQPLCEQALRVRLAGGRVVLSGRVDLVLGRRRRLLVDFKDGEPHPEHAEDLRFYALVAALFFGVAPYRVATVYLRALESQHEDVSAETLEHAARRVIAAARAAAALAGGRPAELSPGPHCAWCPRRRSCPRSLAPDAARGGVAPAAAVGASSGGPVTNDG